MFSSNWCGLWMLVFLISIINHSFQSEQSIGNIFLKRHVYDSKTLHSLRPAVSPRYNSHWSPPDGDLFDTVQVQAGHTESPKRSKKKKRGKKGGVKARMARRPRTPVLPIVVTGNARSLVNKHDELQACTRYLHEYRNASIICLSESWLKTHMADSCYDIDGYTLKRSDRDVGNMKKTKGGGVCAYINSRWCHENNVHVIKEHQTPDCEMLCLSIRPYYLPREFNKVILNVVYIPCDANSNNATAEINNILNEQLTSSPDSIILTSGDFNHRSIDTSLPFYQHVTCVTRDKSSDTLDYFYSNIKDGYTSKALPPLSTSDHNMILMMPKYKTKLMTEKVTTKKVQIWNKEGIERLQGCFDCTDFDVFCESL